MQMCEKNCGKGSFNYRVFKGVEKYFEIDCCDLH